MKLISVNIEENKHFDTVLPFVSEEKPDVLCVQECLKSDLGKFESLGYLPTFLPMTLNREASMPGEFGIAICTLKGTTYVTAKKHYYYHDETGTLPIYNPNQAEDTVNTCVLFLEVTHQDVHLLIGTTHFTWAKKGDLPTPIQTSDLGRLLQFVSTLPPHIICGDFNLPRHENPLYDELVRGYENSVPESYASSLDKSLHRLGEVPDAQILFTDYMVDHLLVQPPYCATDVRLQFGISDHAAIVATITRE